MNKKIELLILIATLLLTSCASQKNQIYETQLPEFLPVDKIEKTGPAPTPSPSQTPNPSIIEQSMQPNIESPCEGTTFEINLCLSEKAVQATKELEALINLLDEEFPNGKWEEEFGKWYLPQERWKKLLDPFCEFEVQDWLGGSGWRGMYQDCIIHKTNERIETLKDFSCLFLDSFSLCLPSKAPGD